MKRRLKRFASSAALILCLAAGASMIGCVEADDLPTAPNTPGIRLGTHVQDWRDEVIYQLIVDRFNNGDINNDFNVDTRSLSRYHGGDWQGIIDKLDYLQALGVTTLWISPPVKNVEEDAGFASYHGYWTVDFLKHNPHFGDLATLRRLSDELHKRNMKLILDIVTNHVGQVFFYDVNMNGQANEWLAGRGDKDKGSTYTDGDLSRMTEYDPDFMAHGIDAYTSMGISGQAPIVFFDMPNISRMAPGPKNIDLDGDGKITTPIEQMGFANPNWYHQRGRTYDYDAGADGCTDYSSMSCKCPRNLTNYDYTDGGFLDGKSRGYCQNDQTLLGDFPGGLKDVATEREDVRRAMVQVFSYWIDVTDCDGFRIDTLKHVEYSFWEYFAAAIRQHAKDRGKNNFLMFGEAFDGNDILLKSYVENENSVDSVFLFSQKYAIDNSIKCGPGNTAPYCGNGSRQNGTSQLYGWDYTWNSGGRHALFSTTPRVNGVVDANGQGVGPRDLLVNFLDNHDVGRYLFDRSDIKGVDSLKNALSFLVMQRGIPCIYYGTEQGFMGGNDPGNREDMWDRTASIFTRVPELGYTTYQAWDTGNPLFLHLQQLIRIRKAVPALRRGTVNDNVWHSPETSGADAGLYAFSRTYEGKSALVAINTNESQAVSMQGKLGTGMQVPWSSGQLVDLLDTSYTVNVSGNIVNVSIPAMKTRILVPVEDKAGYGL
ncbi:MAG: hypothetical protein IKY83_09310 [Proteobacteria bacterium]|nr:hypothetical protein [Pseudomonadota bacterium]